MKFSLAAIPLALLAVSVYLASVRGPFRLSQNFDPEYGYLLSSLSILNARVPTFTDNPGTTVEEIGAGVALGKWVMARAGGGRESISRAILTHPEEYLRAIQFALASLVAASVFWAGWSMFRYTGSLAAGLILQFSVFLFRETLICLARVSPEPLLLAAVFAISAIVIPLVFRTEEDSAGGDAVEKRTAGWAGTLWGFGVTTKFLFVPMAALALVFVSRKARVRFFRNGVLAGLAFALPIWPILYRPAFWLYGLLTHQGYYGEGQRGLPGVALIASNFRSLVSAEPGFFGLVAFYVIVLSGSYAIRSREPLSQRARRFLWVGLLCVALQFAATLKQYRAHYMIPAFGLMALMNGGIVLLLQSRAWKTRWMPIVAALGAVLAVVSLAHGTRRAYEWGQLGLTEQRDAAAMANLASQQGDCVVIGYYRSSHPGFGIGWGSEYAEGASAAAVQEVFPGVINYNRFQHRFLSAAPELRLAEVRGMLAQSRCVLMQGTPVSQEPLVLPSGFFLEPIAELKNEGLYRLAWTDSGR